MDNSDKPQTPPQPQPQSQPTPVAAPVPVQTPAPTSPPSNPPVPPLKPKDTYRKQLPLSQWSSRSSTLYTKLEKVGEGTYGKVFKVEYNDPSKKTSKPQIVALKKILMENEKEGFR